MRIPIGGSVSRKAQKRVKAARNELIRPRNRESATVRGWGPTDQCGNWCRRSFSDDFPKKDPLALGLPIGLTEVLQLLLCYIFIRF